MFGLLSNPGVGFGGRVHRREVVMAPGTHIGFDAELTERLRDEHHEILSICEELEIECARRRPAKVVERLRRLEEQIRQHRLKEDVKLLVFVEKSSAGDSDIAALLAVVRKERDLIRKQLTMFFDKYALVERNSNLLDDLRRDIVGLGSQILQMIEREESDLFPLYYPR